MVLIMLLPLNLRLMRPIFNVANYEQNRFFRTLQHVICIAMFVQHLQDDVWDTTNTQSSRAPVNEHRRAALGFDGKRKKKKKNQYNRKWRAYCTHHDHNIITLNYYYYYYKL